MQDRLAALDANLEEARQVLDTAITFAADCAAAYAKASDPTRKRFNDAVFTRIDVRDGHVTGWEARPLYAELFDGPGFGYGSLVEVPRIELGSRCLVLGSATSVGLSELSGPRTLRPDASEPVHR